MRRGDIERLLTDGLITAEQRTAILERYGLRTDTSHVLKVLSLFGGLLVSLGVILLIAANWEEIPRLVKVGTGLLLMLGAYGTGWYFAEVRRSHAKTAESFYFIGSLLFLGNLALCGQVYHSSARLSLMFLVWWAGIAALPWILRSAAQHGLTLLALPVWLACEINDPAGPLHLFAEQYQVTLFSLLGLLYYAWGLNLRGSRFHGFAPMTTHFGLLLFHALFFPMTWKVFYGWHTPGPALVYWGVGLGAVAVGLLARGLRRESALTPQWRWTWGGALAGLVLLMVLTLAAQTRGGPGGSQPLPAEFFAYALLSIAWFVVALLQVQVGIQLRDRALLNLGVGCAALGIFATYLNLFGSMARTGSMFVVSGLFLLGLGYYLETKRRALLQRLQRPGTPHP